MISTDLAYFLVLSALAVLGTVAVVLAVIVGAVWSVLVKITARLPGAELDAELRGSGSPGADGAGPGSPWGGNGADPADKGHLARPGAPELHIPASLRKRRNGPELAPGGAAEHLAELAPPGGCGFCRRVRAVITRHTRAFPLSRVAAATPLTRAKSGENT